MRYDGTVPLDPGESFERYTIEQRIGLGGLGEVYRAFDTRLLRSVAIKIIRRDRVHDWSSAAARFLREARVAASLQHPNTVAIHDLGEVRGTLFIVMELIRGNTLRSFIGDASIPVELRLEWLAGTARGLAAAHEAGIIHRDVKPANIMITSEGVPKVLDFGLAKAVDEDGEGFTTKVGQLLGTPRYMAPEQREGKGVDERSDQYSFGVMAYELLAQVHPDTRRGTTRPLEVAAPWLTPTIAASIDRMMSTDPSDRYPSMPVAAAAIDAYARTNSISASMSVNLGARQATSGPRDHSTTEQFVPSIVRSRSTQPPTEEDGIPISVAPPREHTEEMSTRVRAVDPRAQALAQVFASSFADETIGPGRYVIELRATERSTHPLVLVPRESAYGAIILGSVSVANASAELHAFDYVAIMHAQRGTPKQFLDRATYEKSVLKRVRTLLKANGVTSFAIVAAPIELRRAFAAQRSTFPPPDVRLGKTDVDVTADTQAAPAIEPGNGVARKR